MKLADWSNLNQSDKLIPQLNTDDVGTEIILVVLMLYAATAVMVKTSETLTGLQIHSEWSCQINMEFKSLQIGLLPVIGWQIVPKFPRTLVTKHSVHNKSISVHVTWLLNPMGQNPTTAVRPGLASACCLSPLKSFSAVLVFLHLRAL